MPERMSLRLPLPPRRGAGRAAMNLYLESLMELAEEQSRPCDGDNVWTWMCLQNNAKTVLGLLPDVMRSSIQDYLQGGIGRIVPIAREHGEVEVLSAIAGKEPLPPEVAQRVRELLANGVRD